MNIQLLVRLIKLLSEKKQEVLEKNMWIRSCFLVFISLIQISWSNMPDGQSSLANFTKKFKEEVSRDYGLRLVGSGASFPVKIEDVILRFQANYCTDVKAARKLAVELVHKMIERMNQDPNLLKYLSSNPATVKHVDLIISFKNPDDKTPDVLDSVMIIGLRNKVVYNTYSEDRTRLRDLHKETFEDAERIVRQE